MTALPDPAELAPTRDPAAYGRRRLMSGGFWVMMGFCVLCLLAAAAIVTLGPRLMGTRPAASTRPVAPPTAPLVAQVPTPPPAAAPLVSGSPDEVAALGDRVSRLEAGDARVLGAAAEALAAAALTDATAQPRSFAAELAACERVLPASPQVLALRPLAGEGAPTRAALAEALADIASRASMAARAPGKGAGIMAQISYAVSRVVNVRRLDATGAGADAVLVRAQRRAADGDLEGAVAMLDKLSAAARTPLLGWSAEARRRIAIDQDVAALRAQAVVDLATARQPRS